MSFFSPRRDGAALTPLEDVTALGEEDGAAVFKAEGYDPQMLWRPGVVERATLLGAAALRVRLELVALDGRLKDPCVYFDWGDGFSEETRKSLSPIGPGTYAAVGHSNAGVCRAVRFDPSATACTFAVRRFVVEPVGHSGPAVPRLSFLRRLARKVLRRLPQSLQADLRRFKAVMLDPNARARPLGKVGALLDLNRNRRWRAAYVHAFEVARNLRSPFFAAPPLEPPRRDPADAKVVAFYLPQFHPTPENDQWWGKGFTEWSNVAKATPQFAGHWQPRLPSDLGYYDLRVPEVLKAQAELAKLSGVDAFCFHYYWFGGRRVLEAPLDRFVADPEIDLPFALCWANENWTRRWDGLESEVLLAQKHSAADDLAVFADMARYMKSERYLRIGGKPLLVVYRPDVMPEPAKTTARWRKAAKAAGLGELFLLCTDAFGFADYARHGFDGLVEFPPHAISAGEITHRVELLNPSFAGRVYDYQTVVGLKESDLAVAEDPRRFPGVMPSWDNEARKPGAGHVFHGATPELFHRWLTAALGASRRNAPEGERLVFVNAWNEWAEGTYLEPDRWFGHGAAQALRSALQLRAPRLSSEHPLVVGSKAAPRRHDAVGLVHLYYPELIASMAEALGPLAAEADLMISFPDHWAETELGDLAAAFPTAWLEPCPNRGRDVEPFLGLLGAAKARGYARFCKLHSKRSPHLHGGEAVRDRLVEALAGADALKAARQRFEADLRLGLLAPKSSQVRLGDHGVMYNNQPSVQFLARRFDFTHDDQTSFPGGTMFWGRMAAFDVLTGPVAKDLPFETEMARIDGTLAHAFERAMGAIAAAAGYTAEYSL
jgi:lipopolysaccharide biosynthesis protein